MKHEVFDKELKLIRTDSIREFAICAIEDMPDYFFTIPASSTGKYHPSYALGDGGLMRHTKAAVHIANDLLNLESCDWTQEQKDLVLTALFVHDGRKSGNEHGAYTVTEHPLLQVESMRNNKQLSSMLSEEDFNLVCSMISTHMGQWNKDYKTGVEVMDKPSSPFQHFVHLCDYLASRKYLEFNFEVI